MKHIFITLMTVVAAGFAGWSFAAPGDCRTLIDFTSAANHGGRPLAPHGLRIDADQDAQARRREIGCPFIARSTASRRCIGVVRAFPEGFSRPHCPTSHPPAGA